jgi:hypothetical protein
VAWASRRMDLGSGYYHKCHPMQNSWVFLSTAPKLFAMELAEARPAPVIPT